MKKEKLKTLLKTVAIFIVYIFYTNIVGEVLSFIGITNDIFVMFIADLIFFLIIIVAYKNNLKQDFEIFIKNYNWKRKMGVIAKYVVLIFLLNLVMGMITEIFIPNSANISAENDNSINNLFEISTIYTLFKTLIFATIAEELLFMESMRGCITNNVAFVVLSSLIYAIMNIVFTDLTSKYIIIDFMSYLLPYLLLSFAYLKNNDNIIVVILIKFVYNLIPTLLLLAGAF